LRSANCCAGLCIFIQDGFRVQSHGDLVSAQNPHAPFAPRGIVLKDNVLYVANLQDSGTTKAGIAPDGEIDKYDATTGQFLGAFPRPAGWVGQFNPRAVVFGPDGNLYVSVFDSSNPSTGSVLKVNVTTGVESLFASTTTGAPDLHRPEGLTFGPDGKLYVTGFRADASDTDKIVVLDPTSGAEVNSIALDAVGQPRAYGQALLFGPGGRLFVPITTLGSPSSGAVRSYDVSNGNFVNFEAPGTLGSGWYLTFRNTDPATLAYVDPVPASSAAPALAAVTAPPASGAAPTTATPAGTFGTVGNTAAASTQAALPAALGLPAAGPGAPAAAAAGVPPASAAVSATGTTAGPAVPAAPAVSNWFGVTWGEDDLSGNALADPLAKALTW
jgi:hypothetical protein